MGTVHGFEHEAVEELVVREDAFRGDDFLAGAFVDAVGEALGNGVETVEDFCAGASGVGAFLELVVFDDGTELTIFVVGEVAAGFVEGEFADVRGEDLAVALAGEFGADEVLEFLTDDSTFGGPEDEALADVVVDVEELEFAAEFTVVAFFGFFEGEEVLFEVFFGFEGGAVEPLELAFGFIAHVEGRGDGHEFDVFTLTGVVDVRAGAEVEEVAVLEAGDFLVVGDFVDEVEFEAAGVALAF
jgi:hypothetical protein